MKSSPLIQKEMAATNSAGHARLKSTKTYPMTGRIPLTPRYRRICLINLRQQMHGMQRLFLAVLWTLMQTCGEAAVNRFRLVQKTVLVRGGVSHTYAGKKRVQTPSCSITPFSSAAVYISRVSEIFSANGFSHKTCLPAAIARSVCSLCSLLIVPM